MKYSIEPIRSGFMGFPFIFVVWEARKVVNWGTDENLYDYLLTVDDPETVAIYCSGKETRIRSASTYRSNGSV